MMLLLDPFILAAAIVCAIFDKLSIGGLLVYVQLFKSIVGGELCFGFLRQYKCSKKSAIFASYVFSYCGYMIATGQHYMYSTLPILAVLSLLGVNQYLIKRKKGLLIFGSAVVAMLGPYVAFPTYLMIAVYVCVRVGLQDKKSIASKTKEVLKTGILMVIGLFASASPFGLQAYDILKVSSRISDTSWIQKITSGFFGVPFEYIKTGFLRFFSNNLEGTVNHWNGVGLHFSALPHFFSVLFVLCVAQFLYRLFTRDIVRKKKILFLSLFTIFLFSICNAFIPMMFNMFARLEYRYVFIWLPFFALLMAFTLDQIFVFDIFSRFVNLLATILCLLLVTFMTNDTEHYVLQAKFVALFSLGICTIMLDLSKADAARWLKAKKKVIFGVLFIVVSIELLIDNRIVLYGDRSLLTKEEYHGSYWDPDMRELVDYINETEEDNFIRVERTYLGYGTPDVMLSALLPYRSVSVYNSTLNSNIFEYTQRFFPEGAGGITQIAYNIGSYGIPFDTITTANLGIKYLITDYEYKIEGWDLLKSCNNRLLYKNKFIDSAGLVYKNAVSQTDFYEMSLMNQKTLMSQAIVLEDENINTDWDEEGLYYEKVEDAIVQIVNQDGEIIMLDNRDGIDLKEPNSVIVITLDNSKLNRDNRQAFFRVTVTSSDAGKLSVIQNNGVVDTWVNSGTAYLDIPPNNQMQELVLPLMADTIAIRVNCVGSNMRLENLEVMFNNPIMYSNDAVTFENRKMGSIVEGQVELSESAFLLMPIVYEDGWHVYVDGEKEDILKANFGLSAVILEEGKHDIVFEYKNPVFKATLVVACIGWGCVIGMLLAHFYKKYAEYILNVKGDNVR